jgi:hypothetical protein
MSNCGCGCSGTGNCNQNLNSYNPNNNSTGNFQYNSTAITCANNSSLSVPTGTGLNTILQNLLNQVCSLSNKTYLAYLSRDKTLTAAITVDQQLDSFTFAGTNNLQIGEMIRIVFAGRFQTGVGGDVLLKARVYGKDSSGVTTTPTNFLSFNTGPNVTIANHYWYTVELTKISNLLVHVNVNGRTRLGPHNNTNNINQSNIGMTGNLSTHDLVIDFVANRANIADQFSIGSISMEHIRP